MEKLEHELGRIELDQELLAVTAGAVVVVELDHELLTVVVVSLGSTELDQELQPRLTKLEQELQQEQEYELLDEAQLELDGQLELWLEEKQLEHDETKD